MTLTIRQVVLAYIEEHGPMTYAQLREDLPHLDENALATTLRRMRNGTPALKPALFISDWTMEKEGERNYPRPVMSLKRSPFQRDLKRPPTPKRIRRKEDDRKIERLRHNSVFNLGATHETPTPPAV